METILIVDDLPVNRMILKEIFKEQYRVLEAGDGEEAIEVISEKRDEISLLFLDLMMPKKTGLDVLAFMNEEKLIDSIPVIMITGEATTESDLKAYEYGTSDIIYKPFEPIIVMRRAKNMIELYQKKKSVEEELTKRTKELRESKEQLAKNNEFLVNALGTVVEFGSAESGDHIQRVKTFTKIILNSVKTLYPEYNLSDEQIELISTASALHDVGKIAIGDSILAKPGALTKDEFEEMKKHTIYGCEILESFKLEESEFYKYCYDICRWHHEKYDGKGYPDQIAGEEIPIWAQVTGIADCFDALVSKRVYKDAYATETAYDMIKRGECGLFSDQLLDAFEFSKPELFALVEEIDQ